MKRLLMIAYHFPPYAASSGIQRTLAFARELPRFGWEPFVLAPHVRAYDHVNEHNIKLNGAPVVERAFALDTARHLSIMGRYPAFAARPDRWISWWLGAVPKGLAMVRRYRPHAIWSTYPIATAHTIGATLHRLTGLPWIADFRDPMAQDGYPEDRKTWDAFKRIEETAIRNASRSVFVTPGAARMYRERYGDAVAPRISVIENGYDEQAFADVQASAPHRERGRPLLVLHSGIVYPSERDPTQLFEAVRRLYANGSLQPGDLIIRLRASGHEPWLRERIEAAGVAQFFDLAPTIPYREALAEMMSADALLVLQAANCNDQVPAKLYEYLRCGRPVLALTDPRGDTASLVRRAGLRDIAPLDSAEDIARTLVSFVEELGRGAAALPSGEFVSGASRAARTAELAKVLDAL